MNGFSNARSFVLVLCLLLAATGAAWSAGATEERPYPDRDIEIIVARGAGGGSDLNGRTIARLLDEYFEGVSVVVVNKPGGDGVIGQNAIAGARPDGYTLGIGSDTVLAGHELLMEDAQYTVESFEYLAGLVVTSNLLIVPPGSRFNTLDELVEYGRNNPGRLTLGMPSVAAETVGGIQQATGVEFTTVVHAGGGDNLAAIAGGHVDAGVLTAQFAPQVEEHGGKVLGVISAERFDIISHIPTFKEQGYDVVVELNWLLTAPKGIPEERLEILDEALTAIGNDPKYNEAFAEINAIGRFQDRRQVTEHMRRVVPELQEYIKVVADDID